MNRKVILVESDLSNYINNFDSINIFKLGLDYKWIKDQEAIILVDTKNSVGYILKNRWGEDDMYVPLPQLHQFISNEILD